jgi:hypothetical protein
MSLILKDVEHLGTEGIELSGIGRIIEPFVVHLAGCFGLPRRAGDVADLGKSSRKVGLLLLHRSFVPVQSRDFPAHIFRIILNYK